MKTKVQIKNQKRFSLVDKERRFKRACEQIVQLNYSLDALQQRYSKAKNDNNRSFRYSLRLKIAVVDGMRNMYYDYAHKKAESIAELRQELFGEVVDIVSGDQDIEMADWFSTQIESRSRLHKTALLRATNIFQKDSWIVIQWNDLKQ